MIQIGRSEKKKEENTINWALGGDFYGSGVSSRELWEIRLGLQTDVCALRDHHSWNHRPESDKVQMTKGRGAERN